MHSRVPKRLLILVAVVAVGVVGLFPTLPVRADITPPFEVVFPQEVLVTEFSSTYGAPRSGERRHKGTDLMALKMTEVYAVADGVVTHIGTHHLAGRNMRIDHGDGWESYYVHLNNDNIGTDDDAAPWSLTIAPGVEEGARVEAGQLIAWVGDSGNAERTAPHTHFEFLVNGRNIDPYPILREAYERALADLEGQTPALGDARPI